MNDKASFKAMNVPFSKVNLQWIAKKMDVQHGTLHGAFEDARVVAQAYKKMIKIGDLI
jgi:DNA polymerase III epsilon subunit-like protein